MEYIGLYLFLAVCLLLMLGYPVAFTLAGTALAFATAGVLAGVFDIGFLSALPGRIFGTVNNTSLIAVPLFILMGTILEKSRVAEELLDSMARLMGGLRGGRGARRLRGPGHRRDHGGTARGQRLGDRRGRAEPHRHRRVLRAVLPDGMAERCSAALQLESQPPARSDPVELGDRGGRW